MKFQKNIIKNRISRCEQTGTLYERSNLSTLLRAVLNTSATESTASVSEAPCELQSIVLVKVECRFTLFNREDKDNDDSTGAA